MLTLALSLLLFLSSPASLEDGRCSHCKRMGWKSTVAGATLGRCTLLGCGGGYYDENGQFHPPTPCNVCSAETQCSNGHRVIIVWKQ